MKDLVLRLIRDYQRSHWLHQPILKALFLSDQSCRFKPSCSEYTYQAIEKYGMIKGSFLGLKRIIRCHPWSRGGYEPLE